MVSVTPSIILFHMLFLVVRHFFFWGGGFTKVKAICQVKVKYQGHIKKKGKNIGTVSQTELVLQFFFCVNLKDTKRMIGITVWFSQS